MTPLAWVAVAEGLIILALGACLFLVQRNVSLADRERLNDALDRIQSPDVPGYRARTAARVQRPGLPPKLPQVTWRHIPEYAKYDDVVPLRTQGIVKLVKFGGLSETIPLSVFEKDIAEASAAARGETPPQQDGPFLKNRNPDA